MECSALCLPLTVGRDTEAAVFLLSPAGAGGSWGLSVLAVLSAALGVLSACHGQGQTRKRGCVSVPYVLLHLA